MGAERLKKLGSVWPPSSNFSESPWVCTSAFFFWGGWWVGQAYLKQAKHYRENKAGDCS